MIYSGDGKIQDDANSILMRKKINKKYFIDLKIKKMMEEIKLL